MTLMSLILGRPLASQEKENEKIGPLAGVPAMGLDALTSAAYGPEAALTILSAAGVAGVWWIQPITGAILFLLALLYFSYRQTVAAYPVNGGSYTVARENLGTWAGLLAAAALMIDYVLNVAVGISAGIAALVSAVPELHPYTLLLCLIALAVITIANLRGTAEAGILFSIPTYLFLGSLGLVLILGLAKAATGGGHPDAIATPPAPPSATVAISTWLVLRSFASGCTAMTGVEAISNGVGAFREPRVPNAHRTLTAIVLLLAALLAAIAFLCHVFGIAAMDQTRPGYQSVLSQLTSAILGRGWFYYLTVGSVLAVLCLSANTSFVGFPRLSKLVAQDDFLPRAFTTVGRRLVYSVGILFLATTAGLLLVVFRGITDRLIPLFAVGAFLAFTLSQTGMVIHWRNALRSAQGRELPWARWRMWINGVGAVATAAALVIIILAKFIEGAWIAILAIPILLTLFRLVHGHYRRLDEQTAPRQPLDLTNNPEPVVLVPMRRWDRLTNKSLRFAMWLSPDLIALHLTNLSGEEAQDEQESLRRQWKEEVEQPAQSAGVPAPKLRILESPYREFLQPLLEEIDRVKKQCPGRTIAIIVAEVVERHWWEYLLHRRHAARLRNALIKRGDRRVVVVTVPWYFDSEGQNK